MASSRTGTTQWANVSRKVIKDAQAQGITQCPYCDTHLDYTNRRAPNGATVDHKLAHANGGTDDYHNLQVCCFTCNISKGKHQAPKRRTILNAKPLKTSRKW